MMGQFDDILGSDDKISDDKISDDDFSIENFKKKMKSQNRRIIEEYEKILKRDMEKLNEKNRD